MECESTPCPRWEIVVGLLNLIISLAAFGRRNLKIHYAMAVIVIFAASHVHGEPFDSSKNHHGDSVFQFSSLFCGRQCFRLEAVREAIQQLLVATFW